MHYVGNMVLFGTHSLCDLNRALPHVPLFQILYSSQTNSFIGYFTREKKSAHTLLMSCETSKNTLTRPWRFRESCYFGSSWSYSGSIPIMSFAHRQRRGEGDGGGGSGTLPIIWKFTGSISFSVVMLILEFPSGTQGCDMDQTRSSSPSDHRNS